jgi:hypothetical protein
MQSKLSGKLFSLAQAGESRRVFAIREAKNLAIAPPREEINVERGRHGQEVTWRQCKEAAAA